MAIGKQVVSDKVPLQMCILFHCDCCAKAAWPWGLPSGRHGLLAVLEQSGSVLGYRDMFGCRQLLPVLAPQLGAALGRGQKPSKSGGSSSGTQGEVAKHGRCRLSKEGEGHL